MDPMKLSIAILVLAAGSCFAGPITFTNIQEHIQNTSVFPDPVLPDLTQIQLQTLQDFNGVSHQGFQIGLGPLMLRNISTATQVMQADISAHFTLIGYILTGVQVYGRGSDDGNNIGENASAGAGSDAGGSCGGTWYEGFTGIPDCSGPTWDITPGTSGTFHIDLNVHSDIVPPNGEFSIATAGATVQLFVQETPEPQPFILAFGGLALLTLIRFKLSH